MPDRPTRIGRPRSFDESQVLDQALEVFWRLGSAGTTTRVLESELGMTQSSIYNAFGSKQALLERSVDRYLDRIDREVVSGLDRPSAGEAELLRFVDDVVAWVTNRDRPGCLLLNLLVEVGRSEEPLVDRATAYRERLRVAFGQAFERAGADDPPSHAELMLASVLGINVAARGGAGPDEVAALAEALRAQIRAWTA